MRHTIVVLELREHTRILGRGLAVLGGVREREWPVAVVRVLVRRVEVLGLHARRGSWGPSWWS